MQKLEKRSVLATAAGVNPSTVTRLLKGSLSAAVVGNRVDMNHPDVLGYLKDRAAGTTKPGVKKAKKAPPPPAKIKPAPPPPARDDSDDDGDTVETKINPALDVDGHIVEIPEDIQMYADMTLREIIKQFGTAQRFNDFLKAVKEIEMINERRLKNAEKQGQLVSRSLIKVGIIEPIDTAHNKLLTDGAKKIAVRCYAMAKSGKETEQLEMFVKETITSFIRPSKQKAVKTLSGIGEKIEG